MGLKQPIGILAALAVLVGLSACSAFAPAINLNGTEWILASLNGANLTPGTTITLNFSDGQAAGFSGCNAYHGPYSANNGPIKVAQFEITAMACREPTGVMQQEQAYTETLQNAAAFRIVDGRLEISNPAGETRLVFNRKARFAMNPHDLLGTHWQLVSMNGAKLIEGSTITLEFIGDSKVSGHAGCRDYSASYVAHEDVMDFQTTKMIGDVCPSNALLEQEGRYTTILSWTDNYRLSKDQLEFSSARGEALTYLPLGSSQPSPYEGTEKLPFHRRGTEIAENIMGKLCVLSKTPRSPAEWPALGHEVEGQRGASLR